VSTIREGTLEAFVGSWLSGLATLVISGVPVPCENGPTGRALAAAYGEGVIAEGHTIDSSAFRGRSVVYAVDDALGLLEWFAPSEEWAERDVPSEVQESQS